MRIDNVLLSLNILYMCYVNDITFVLCEHTMMVCEWQTLVMCDRSEVLCERYNGGVALYNVNVVWIDHVCVVCIYHNGAVCVEYIMLVLSENVRIFFVEWIYNVGVCVVWICIAVLWIYDV